MMNPYHWQSSEPRIQAPQAEVGEIVETLGEGGSALVLGGRGMGKSVFLGQLRRTLGQSSNLVTVVVASPPPRLDVESCLKQLAKVLEVSIEKPFNTKEIIDAWFARGDVPQRLVLLFDEFDRYAESHGGQASPNPPGRAFFNDLEITRRHRLELGVLATGSVGVFTFRDSLGSSFLSRAAHFSLSPFDRPTIAGLARPFAERGGELSGEVLDSLLLASGGVPALLTYGLQELWKVPHEPTARNVADLYARFQERHRGYLDDVYRAFVDPALSGAPLRVLDLLRQSSGPLPRATLEAACEEGDDPLRLNLPDVLEVLKAAGLARIEGSVFAGDPVRARAIPSLLNLPSRGPEALGFRERLRRDLELLLAKLHRASVDFFRPGKGGGKQLVPESVFAAHLALGFDLLGWKAEREAQSAAGRTDLKLRYNSGDQVAVVEVKIWGRPGAKEAQQQVESYWTAEFGAGAVVQITDADLVDWPEVYRREALDGKGRVETIDLEDSVIRACFGVRSDVQNRVAEIDHLLLRLARR